jgi:phosphoglycolate phosphatase
LLRAIRMVGGSTERAVMVGDSGTDISTARAAGVPSIAVTFGYTEIPAKELGADATIDDYLAFDWALRHVLAGRAFTSS